VANGVTSICNITFSMKDLALVFYGLMLIFSFIIVMVYLLTT